MTQDTRIPGRRLISIRNKMLSLSQMEVALAQVVDQVAPAVDQGEIAHQVTQQNL